MRFTLAFALGVIPALVAGHSISRRTVTQTEIANLNTTVGGRLFAGYHWSRPCYSFYDGQSQEPNQAQCQLVQEDYFNNSRRFLILIYDCFFLSKDQVARSDNFGAWGAVCSIFDILLASFVEFHPDSMGTMYEG